MSDDLDLSHCPTSDVHIVGGGLGGLAAAALVARAGRTVTVHEGRGRLGGRGTTDWKRGFGFNQGPHALYLAGEAQSCAALARRSTVGAIAEHEGRVDGER